MQRKMRLKEFLYRVSQSHKNGGEWAVVNYDRIRFMPDNQCPILCLTNVSGSFNHSYSLIAELLGMSRRMADYIAQAADWSVPDSYRSRIIRRSLLQACCLEPA